MLRSKLFVFVELFRRKKRVLNTLETMDMDMANIGAILDRVGIVNMVGMMKMVNQVARVDNSQNKIYHKSHFSEFSHSS